MIKIEDFIIYKLWYTLTLPPLLVLPLASYKREIFCSSNCRMFYAV